MSSVKHEPVLLHEVLEYLRPESGNFMIDGTVDGGGHAAAIVKKIMPGGTFLGVDWDHAMIAKYRPTKKERYVQGNYADLPDILSKEKLGKADGVLLDLGFSSEQLAASQRGFSFGGPAADEPLLMTYDDARTPVHELLRGMKEEELANIIYEFGGERMSRRIAKAIVEAERKHPIATSGELANVVRGALPKSYERGRIDPATRTFQALRIYANDELENLKRAIENLGEILQLGGRIVILTFHSLEDRIVKQAFQALSKEKKLEILTKKPIEASREEIMANPRSRSAKLRAARIPPSLSQ